MNAYLDEMILSASPVELIRLLFRRAIARIREARIHLRAGRIEERSAAIGGAYRIVTELMNSLDSNAEPVLTARLKALYCYIQQRLLEANFRQTDAPLAEALGILGTVGEAWEGVPSAGAESTTPADRWTPADLVADESASFVLTA